MPIVPNLNGGTVEPGGGSPPGSSGGGGSPSSPAPINLANLPTTGGLQGFFPVFLISGFDEFAQTFLMYQQDSTQFNCEEDVEYDFRLEEISPGNDVTIHNIVLRYRDLGVVTFTVYIVSTDNTIKPISRQITIGNTIPTNKLFTFKVDISSTFEAPQIKIIRKANAGPLCITKVLAVASYGTGDVI